MSELDLAIARRRQKLEDNSNSNQTTYASSSNHHQYETQNHAGDDSNSAWTLYYSEEGYPYYYNHYTGESQWCEQYTEPSNNISNTENEYHNTNDTVYSSNQYTSSDIHNANTGEYSDNNEEDSDYSQENSENSQEEDEESDETEEDSDNSEESESDSENEVTDAKFAEYLRTAAGEALRQKEQDRLERKLNKRQLKAEQDKTYAAKKNIRRSKPNKKGRDDIQYLSGLVPFNELTPEKEKYNQKIIGSTTTHLHQRMAPSPPTSSRLMSNAPLTDRSQYGQDAYPPPPPPQWDTHSNHKPHSKPNRNTPIYDEENYYHDKAYKSPGVLGLNGGEDSSTSSDDFSDDSDLDEIEAPVVPEWLKWQNIKEQAQKIVNSTIIVGNQWVIRGLGSDADLTQTIQRAGNASIAVMNNLAVNANSLVSYTNDLLERNNVYELLNSTIEIPIPTNLTGIVTTTTTTRNADDGVGTADTNTLGWQSTANATASTVWSYVSYGVSRRLVPCGVW